MGTSRQPQPRSGVKAPNMDTMMPACCSLYLPRRGADAGKAHRCPDLAVAFAMKWGGADLDPHVFNQFSIRAKSGNVGLGASVGGFVVCRTAHSHSPLPVPWRRSILPKRQR